MTKAENYLSNRLSMLSDEKIIITTKINNLDIEIEEINEKIREISNDMDFSFISSISISRLLILVVIIIFSSDNIESLLLR